MWDMNAQVDDLKSEIKQTNEGLRKDMLKEIAIIQGRMSKAIVEEVRKMSGTSPRHPNGQSPKPSASPRPAKDDKPTKTSKKSSEKSSSKSLKSSSVSKKRTGGSTRTKPRD